jgi:RNA polymerase sigma-70 factor (ECF subfamily)
MSFKPCSFIMGAWVARMCETERVFAETHCDRRRLIVSGFRKVYNQMTGLMLRTPGVRTSQAAHTSEGASIHDDDLISACKEGNRCAWNELVKRYEPAAFRLAFKFAGNRDDAEDVVSLVFIRVYSRIQTFRAGSCFGAWLSTVVRNTYIDSFVRSRNRKRQLSLSTLKEGEDLPARDVVDPSPSPMNSIIIKQRDELVRETISHLPGYQRQLMDMYYSEGKSYSEISRRTGLPEGTVKSRMFRARHNLRDRLEPFAEYL